MLFLLRYWNCFMLPCVSERATMCLSVFMCLMPQFISINKHNTQELFFICQFFKFFLLKHKGFFAMIQVSLCDMIIDINKIVLTIQLTCMEEPQSMVINEQQKESNPIFKVVFNKIRNLRKKVAQIQHIKTLDQKALKPAQLEKLSKQTEICDEIEKYEEFARQYKQILIENNLVYDKVDDLIKISTILTVGKRIKITQYCPFEVKNVYEKFYQKIFGKGQQYGCKNLSDEVIRVYHLLWQYLQKDSYYSQCRDYLTYFDDINERIKQQKVNKPYTNAKKDKKEMVNAIQDISPIIAEINKKIQRLSIRSDILKINFGKNIQIEYLSCSHEAVQVQKIISSEKELDLKQDSSTTNPEGEIQIQELQRQIIDSIVHPQNVWTKKHEDQIDQSHIEFHSADNKAIPNNPIKNRANKNRQRKNRRNKKPIYTEFEYNVRKCSDTSLEPTPEKYWGKKKYVQKKQ